MEALATLGVMGSVGITVLSIGIMLGVPMTWYHVGHISRKLSKTNELLAELNKTKA